MYHSFFYTPTLGDIMVRMPKIKRLGAIGRYTSGASKQFQVRRFQNKEGDWVVTIRNLRDKNDDTGVARQVPMAQFEEWAMKLDKTRNPQRQFRSLYRYTDQGSEEMRIAMRDRFLITVNFNYAEMPAELREKINDLANAFTPRQWDKFVKEHHDMWVAYWDKYDLYVEEGRKFSAEQREEVNKIVEAMESYLR